MTATLRVTRRLCLSSLLLGAEGLNSEKLLFNLKFMIRKRVFCLVYYLKTFQFSLESVLTLAIYYSI